MKDTYFAPAQRTEEHTFKEQLYVISNSSLVNSLLNTMEGLMVVLNSDRQIVALNHNYMEMIGIPEPGIALGLRLGETLKCIHAESGPAGCGTTPHCSTCGAAIAMMKTIHENEPDEQICALSSNLNGVTREMCLLIKSRPLFLDTEKWILIFAQDITKQQFFSNMEKIFFHDINNLITSISGNIELLKQDFPGNERLERTWQAIQRLNSEFSFQRKIAIDNTEEIKTSRSRISLNEIRNDLNSILENHISTKNRTFEQQWPESNIILDTDINLLSRVLLNMIINAMEAAEPSQKVKLNTHATDNYVQWDVWNGETIPEDIQMRIFQMFFSTKQGKGRGLGTFSMKLLGEQYLGGTVFFSSTPDDGTTFSFRLPRKNAE